MESELKVREVRWLVQDHPFKQKTQNVQPGSNFSQTPQAVISVCDITSPSLLLKAILNFLLRQKFYINLKFLFIFIMTFGGSKE